MGEQQYLAHHSLPHPDSLAKAPGFSDDARSPSARGGSAYPDLVYSATASFNYPASCDSSLLTPTSSSGSPHLHHLSRKGTHSYPAPGTPPQDNTPPDSSSSNMYSPWGPYTTSSPMTTSATVAPDYSTPYSHDGRRTPAPPEPYYGSYGVSTAGDHSVESSYYMSVPAVGPGLINGQPLPIPGDHVRATLPTHSILGPQGRASMPRRISGVEESMLPMPQDLSRSIPPVRRGAPTRANGKKRTTTRRQSGSRNSAQAVDPTLEHTNCLGEVVPPKLKSSCNEIDRQVFECRWKHREQRGHHMWSLIQAEMEEKTGKPYGREDLQMKFRRARAHIEWLPDDEAKLSQAWLIVEKERYKKVLTIFQSLGGSANMCLNPVDIEAKLVEMKVEEALYFEGPRNTPIRRRLKVSARKRVGEHQPDDELEYLLNERRASDSRADTHTVPYIKQEILQCHGPGFEDQFEGGMLGGMPLNGSGRMTHGM